MKRFLSLFLLCSSVLLIGCSGGPSGYRPQGFPPNAIFSGAVLGSGYKTILYKAQIDVFGRHSSGLFFFKKMPDSDAFRFVFLSEFGLNLLDMEYKNNVFTVKNCQEFLKDESVINTLKNDLGLLIRSLDTSQKLHFFKGVEKPGSAIQFENKTGEYTYFYNPENQLTEIQQDGGAFQGVQVRLTDYHNTFPQQIHFTHDWIKLEIKLKLLKVRS